MLSSSPDELFKYKPQLLEQAFELWRDGKYPAVVRAFFYSTDDNAERLSDEILRSLGAFRFSADVIQCMGALRNSDNDMFYDESFLNMLQRVDFSALKFSRQEKSLNKKPIFSVKGSLLQVCILEQILKTWLYDVSTVIETD